MPYFGHLMDFASSTKDFYPNFWWIKLLWLKCKHLDRLLTLSKFQECFCRGIFGSYIYIQELGGIAHIYEGEGCYGMGLTVDVQ